MFCMIILIIGILFAVGFKDKMAFVWIVGAYIVIKIVWRFLTRR